jgi:hypothetical protein
LTSLFAILLPLVPTPQIGQVLYSCPPAFKFIFTVYRGITVVFCPWIYCTLIKLTSSTYPFSPTSYYSPAFGALHYEASFYFYFLGGTGILTRGLTLGRQAPYHLSDTPALWLKILIE